MSGSMGLSLKWKLRKEKLHRKLVTYVISRTDPFVVGQMTADFGIFDKSEEIFRGKGKY